MIKFNESNVNFDGLGLRDQQLKSPALFYVPFYVVCFQAGLSNRYIFLAPSLMSVIGFAAKLKGALGISKIKEMFIPRFKAITALINQLEGLVKEDSLFETELISLGEKNNLLNTDSVRGDIAKGLVYLKDVGWLSEKQYQSLSISLGNV